ncbi:MAG: hypothetical protein QXQ68_00185 [Candidatus Nitrosocaldaceae archaeon]
MIDIKPSNGSCYIYSSSEPFNEESEIEFNRFINWLDHFTNISYTFIRLYNAFRA